MERWYSIPQLRSFTPRTVFVPLSRPTANALHAHIEMKVYCRKEKIGEEEQKLVEELTQQIHDVIQNEFGNQAFVKLSTRSPKDTLTAAINNRMKEALESELAKSDGSDNGDAIAFCAAVRNAMRVTSGEEALWLIEGSSRVQEDLMKWSECEGKLPLSIVVREWLPMTPSGEFRAFIKEKKLTAVSQYCYYQYFPEVTDQKDKLEETIKAFWESIAESIPHKNCVIDFFITDDTNYIIELNPFFSDTGGCLFSWREKKDTMVIGGQSPFEFRVLTKPTEQPLLCLPTEWIEFIDEYRGRDHKVEHKKRLQSINTNENQEEEKHRRKCCMQ